jgi:hypothetical protein
MIVVSILVSKPNEERLPIIFNVDGVVGAAPAANKPDDVVLVKSFLRMMSDVPLNTNKDLVAACKAIEINTSSDQALIAAIKAFQEDVKKFKNNPGVVVDGRVSPAKESFRYQVGIPWTIVQLNGQMKSASRFGPVWPAIHLSKLCNATLSPIAKKTIFGIDI